MKMSALDLLSFSNTIMGERKFLFFVIYSTILSPLSTCEILCIYSSYHFFFI